MISKGEKEKQRKDLNKFVEQNVQGINKIGVAASGRHVHKKGGGGLRPPPPFLWRPILFIPWTLCSMNSFRSFLCFSFSQLLIIRGRAYFIYEWLNEWMNEWMNDFSSQGTTQQTTITGLWWHGGVRKGRFQQWDTTHSGTGEKETHNINVVGKK